MDRDPSYRYYNCNLQAPNIKCHTLNATNLNFTQMSGLFYQNGETEYAKVAKITPSLLETAVDTVCGDLTIFMKDLSGDKCKVCMITVAKINGVLTPTDSSEQYKYINTYQQYGNIDVTITTEQNKTIVLTSLDFFSTRWIWRGF